MLYILLYSTAENSFPRQLMDVRANLLRMIKAPHTTDLHPASATLDLVRRHLVQINRNSLPILTDHEMLLPLQNILIRRVHKNFTEKNGHAEPILLANNKTCYGQLGWTPILPYIQRQPYVAASRLLYSWECGNSSSHTLRRFFSRDTQSLRDTISITHAMWVTFHDDFPFHDLADLFFRQDWRNFLLCTQLYNAMHDFYFDAPLPARNKLV